jgi:hypothetical protein
MHMSGRAAGVSEMREEERARLMAEERRRFPWHIVITLPARMSESEERAVRELLQSPTGGVPAVTISARQLPNGTEYESDARFAWEGPPLSPSMLRLAHEFGT